MTTPQEVAQLAAPMPAKSGALDRRQKAAIIVRFLLNEGAEVTLSDLPEDLQAELTQAMGRMRYVDRETLGHVVLEFASELESVGLSFPHGISGALNALEGRISPYTAARLRKEAGVRQSGDPWQRIRALPLSVLSDIVTGESIEIAAVLLSKLDVGKAADLLGTLSGEKARRITYAVSKTAGITPEAVDRIGVSLAAQLDDRPPRAFSEDPEARIGAILNSSLAATRDTVLDGLEETDASFASAVRKTIFTFADIPARVRTADVPRIIREVEQDRLVTAIAGAISEPNQQSAGFLLENMSARLADQIREDVEDRTEVSERDAEAAMTEVITGLRALADAGEISLIEPVDAG